MSMQKMPSKNNIGGSSYHFGWDNSLDPVLTVAPGEVVEIEAMDAGGYLSTPGVHGLDLDYLTWSHRKNRVQ